MFKITITETSTNKSVGILNAKTFTCADNTCVIKCENGDRYECDMNKYSIDVSTIVEVPIEPYVGQIIYVPTSLYVYRGRDDFQGGKAVIASIIPKPELPDDDYNKLFVTIKDRPNSEYNWNYLKKQQGIWKEKFGDTWAHPDSDLDPDVNDDNADWK